MRVLLIGWMQQREEEQPGHPEFEKHMPGLAALLTTQHDRLPHAPDGHQSRSAVPRNDHQAFPDNIIAAHADIGNDSADKPCSQLARNGFGFRQFRHGRSV